MAAKNVPAADGAGNPASSKSPDSPANVFTDNDVKIIAAAVRSLTGPPQIDFGKMAGLLNMSNVNSARNAINRILKTHDCDADTSVSGPIADAANGAPKPKGGRKKAVPLNTEVRMTPLSFQSNKSDDANDEQDNAAAVPTAITPKKRAASAVTEADADATESSPLIIGTDNADAAAPKAKKPRATPKKKADAAAAAADGNEDGEAAPAPAKKRASGGARKTAAQKKAEAEAAGGSEGGAETPPKKKRMTKKQKEAEAAETAAREAAAVKAAEEEAAKVAEQDGKMEVDGKAGEGADEEKGAEDANAEKGGEGNNEEKSAEDIKDGESADGEYEDVSMEIDEGEEPKGKE